MYIGFELKKLSNDFYGFNNQKYNFKYFHDIGKSNFIKHKKIIKKPVVHLY